MIATPAYGRYRVTSDRAFRDHDPGSEFVARLDTAHERRAVRRRAIELLERIDFGLESALYVMPKGWEDSAETLGRSDEDRRLSSLERRVEA